MVDLLGASNVFRAGHRIRLDISSSNFPLRDANPNTGQPYAICSKDFLSCTARGRTPRYPGFIYLVSNLTQAIEGQQPNVLLSNPLSSVLTTPWETP